MKTKRLMNSLLQRTIKELMRFTHPEPLRSLSSIIYLNLERGVEEIFYSSPFLSPLATKKGG